MVLVPVEVPLSLLFTKASAAAPYSAPWGVLESCCEGGWMECDPTTLSNGEVRLRVKRNLEEVTHIALVSISIRAVAAVRVCCVTI